MDNQPRYHLYDCPFCTKREPIPSGLRHCDFCHRNFEPDMIHYISNAQAADGRMKGICEYCVDTN
jgi:hypothetical protein